MKNRLETTVDIDNSPENVMAYIADVRNRPLYLPSLKSVRDIQGEPDGEGVTWRWTWAWLGVELEGTGRCESYEAGKKYVMTTQGGIESRFTYRAEPAGEGTKLTVEVEFETPESLLSKAGINNLLESAKQRDAEQAAANLKTILDQ